MSPKLRFFWRLCLALMLGPWSWGHGARAQDEQTMRPPRDGQDFISARAFWFDPTGHAGLRQAQSQEFKPYEGVLNQGYTGGAHWVRLSLRPSTQDLVLRLQPAWLDHVRLYDPLDGQAPRAVGDHLGRDHNAFFGLGFSLRLTASAQPRDVWLRIQSSSVHRLGTLALPVAEAIEASARHLVWSSFYAATLLLMFLALLMAWLSQRDRLLGAFLLRHAGFSWFAISYLGLPTVILGDALSPNFFDKAFSLATLMALPLGIWFDIALLRAYRPQRYLLGLLTLLGLVGVGVVLAFVAGLESSALEWNVHLIALVVLVELVAALSCRPDPTVEQLMPKRFMVGYYLLILSGLLFGVVGLLGWTQPSGWGLYVLILHGLVSSLVMMLMLFVRNSRLIAQSRQMGWQLQQAQGNLELEQHRRQEQSQFLHMLMHELKTPLSIVSMALGTRANKARNLELAAHAVQDMKAVIERCVLADRLDERAQTMRLEPVDLNHTLDRLAQGIPDLGPRARLQRSGDLILRTDAQLLQTVLSNLLDNALRYGDAHTPVDIDAQPELRDGRDGVRVRVSNTPGLAGWPDPEKLFGKYYRSDGAHRTSGTGLGLFLARQLATTLGATLSYLPTDTLARFELWIPRAPA